MQAPARSLDQVVDAMTDALSELDSHGHTMAALHLAMALDSLRASLDAGPDNGEWANAGRVQLRLVASS